MNLSSTSRSDLHRTADLLKPADEARGGPVDVDFAAEFDAQRQIRKLRQDLLKTPADAQMRVADIERPVGEDL